MHILRIEHPVPDYDAWKQAFDSDPIGREREAAFARTECSVQPTTRSTH